MIHLGDITKINGAEIPVVDAVIGGSPCQDLSIAGKRAGLQGERSGLFMEQLRAIKEMREKDASNGRTGHMVRPRYMVWENVPGAFSSQKGEDFRAVLEETAKVADPDAAIPRPAGGKWKNAGCIMGDGWSIAWRVMDAQYWGVPQRRRRIALVADFGGSSAPEILFERQSVRGNPAESETPRETTAADVKYSAQSSDNAGVFAFFKNTETQSSGITQTHVVYDCRENGDGDICPTLTGDHQNRATDYTAICIQGNCIDRADTAGCNGKGWRYDTAYTLNTIDRHAAALPFDTTQITCPTNCSNPQWGEPCHGLSSYAHPPAIATIDCRSLCLNDDISGTLQAKSTGGQSLNYTNPVMAPTLDANYNAKFGSWQWIKQWAGFLVNYAVRRLTPLECERLQGYPDNWTLIPDYIDSKGKRKKVSDSARYKALGNSIALPQWEWLLGHISKQYSYTPTLGSLFDGIGGFPLCWERVNGPGTALWASEIEEFPIAVTKYRFGGQKHA